jgi:hypothetical protein
VKKIIYKCYVVCATIRKLRRKRNDPWKEEREIDLISRFDEVKHYPLKVFNRCVVASNLLEDGGRAAVEDYVEDFTDKEKADMQAMYLYVKKYGYKKAKDVVTEGLEFTDEEFKGVDD